MPFARSFIKAFVRTLASSALVVMSPVIASHVSHWIVTATMKVRVRERVKQKKRQQVTQLNTLLPQRLLLVRLQRQQLLLLRLLGMSLRGRNLCD